MQLNHSLANCCCLFRGSVGWLTVLMLQSVCICFTFRLPTCTKCFCRTSQFSCHPNSMASQFSCHPNANSMASQFSWHPNSMASQFHFFGMPWKYYSDPILKLGRPNYFTRKKIRVLRDFLEYNNFHYFCKGLVTHTYVRIYSGKELLKQEVIAFNLL